MIELPFKIVASGLKTREGREIYVLIYEQGYRAGTKRQASEEEVLLWKWNQLDKENT